MANPLTVRFEHPQRRVTRKLLSTMCDRESWDVWSSSDVWQEPVYGTVMLRPRCLYDDWYTSLASPYDKLSLASFAGLTDASWQEHDPSGVGGSRFLTAKADVNETGITTASYSRNRAFCVGFFAYSEGSDVLVLSCGWNDAGNASVGPRVDFYSGGRTVVYHDGEIVGRGQLGRWHNGLAEVMLIPWRRRELGVFSGEGGWGEKGYTDASVGGFSVTMPHVSESDVDPAITPAGKFWFKAYGTPDVQIAPLKFATTGTLYGVTSAFKRAPEALASDHAYYWMDGPEDGTTTSVSVTLTDHAGAAFAPDGTATECRIKAVLTGPGSSTPVLRGARYEYDAATGMTPNAPITVDPYLLSADLRVPDDPGGVELSLTLKSPAELESLGLGRLRTVGNRPVQASLGTVVLLDGRTDDPHWEDSLQDSTRRYEAPVRDAWKVLERTILDDPIPLDATPLRSALIWLLGYCGIPESETDIEDPSFTLPSVSSDDWNLVLEPGETVAECVRQLMEGYASTWVYGFKPYASGVKFFAQSPESLGETIVADLFRTVAEAEAYFLGLGYLAADAKRLARFRVYRNYSESVIEPESNEVYVTGWDARDGRPIVRYVRDEDSIDPTPASADRPDNWLGEVTTVGYYDGSLASEAAVERAASLYAPRLMRPRRLPSFESELLVYSSSGVDVPVWRGDVVRLHDALGTGLHQLVRITALDATFRFEADASGDGQYRTCQYSGEEIV